MFAKRQAPAVDKDWGSDQECLGDNDRERLVGRWIDQDVGCSEQAVLMFLGHRAENRYPIGDGWGFDYRTSEHQTAAPIRFTKSRERINQIEGAFAPIDTAEGDNKRLTTQPQCFAGTLRVNGRIDLDGQPENDLRSPSGRRKAAKDQLLLSSTVVSEG